MAFWKSIWFALVSGCLLRLGLMVYGHWQDSTMAVKFTDVDYFVFTDAAEFVTKGESPYNRSTYRYTPLLAWILQPNIFLAPSFGKILFISADVIAGFLIYAILRRAGNTDQTAVFCAETWLYNPLTITVSSRGNAESIMAALVLGTLYLLTSNPKSKLSKTSTLVSGAVYGLAVHTKIYPVTYCLPFYLFLNVDKRNKHALKDFLTLTGSRVCFILGAALVFCGLTGICYLWCGFPFLQETYFYHVTRRDTRHNFSPYFYMFYLLGDSLPSASHLLGLLVFLPQVALLILVSVRFHTDLPLCCFLQTFLFVTFNKVCTSQYFLWYLSLLPVVLPQLYISAKDWSVIIALWFLGQAVWLAPAYFLEFQGQNTFQSICLAGFMFFAVNVWIFTKIVKCYDDKLKTKMKTTFEYLIDLLVHTAAGIESKHKKVM